MTYIVTEPYIGTKDQSCVEVCPVDCTYDGGDQFLINPHGCIDCGACEPDRPVEGCGFTAKPYAGVSRRRAIAKCSERIVSLVT
jgi:NAD-dependent dihydropyrimidine dehydrogenase PreA subunit